MSQSTVPTNGLVHVSSTPRRGKRQPAKADIRLIAARLTSRTLKATKEALRSAGCAQTRQNAELVMQAARDIDKVRSIRRARRALATPPSLEQRLASQRVGAVAKCAKATLRYGAAGGSSMRVTFAQDAAAVGYVVHTDMNWTTYAGRFKDWSAKEDHHRICVPQDWRVRVQRRGLAVLGGMMTLDVHPLVSSGDVQLFAATWARQGRGYNVLVDRGFIAKLKDEFFHGKTVEEAVAGVLRKDKAASRFDAYRATVDAFIERFGGMQTIVSVHDAFESGSCEYGVRSWCAAVGLEFQDGEAPLQAVLRGFQLRPQVEVRRAVLHAIRRQRAACPQRREQDALTL